MKYNPQTISFKEAIQQIKTEYLKAKQELERLKEKLKEISNESTAILAISLEAEPRHDQEVNVDKNEHELAQELLSESSEYITEIEKGTDELIKEAEGKGATEIVDEAKIVRKKFRSRVMKFSAVLLLAFSQQVADRLPPTETFADKDKARVELQTKGITSFQGRRYIPGVSEMLFRGVRPVSYMDQATINRFLDTFLNNEGAGGMEEGAKELAKTESNKEYEPHMVKRVDAWRLYLGLPQKHNTFGVSDFKPSNSKEDKYYYKINSFLEGNVWLGDKPGDKSSIERLVRYLGNDKKLVMQTDPNFVMGDYTLSIGEDERGHYISYYDRWDLGPTLEGENGLLGQPFEIYDRIYYDPLTFEIIQPKL